MASLFQGDPQKATSYVTSTSESPKWMQDAIYNQIQMAQNVANRPYEAYSMPTVAELSPLQQQAYQQVQANQGSWAPAMQAAQTGMQGMSTAGTAQGLQGAQGQYLAPREAVEYALNQGQGYYNKAGQQDIVGSAQPYMTAAYEGATAAGNVNTAAGLQAAQGQYLAPREAIAYTLGQGQDYFTRAGQQDITGAAQPYMQQAGATTAEALSERALQAANPYLQAAAQTSAQGVGQYMNPYTEGVTSQIAKLGARNLSENLLPAVSDQFVRAGQFGGTRMGEFGSRALRDTQESVLNQQAQALQAGYGQALGASQADLARQAQLAGTVGSISGADLSRTLQGAGQYGQLASTAGALTGQAQQGLASLGQAQSSLGTTQQQMALSAAQQAQQAQAQDAARQLSAAQQVANIGQNIGGLTQAQMQAMTNLGQAQTNVGQTQQQFGLSAAQAAQQAQASDYSRQMSALNQMAGMAQQGQGMRIADVAALESAGQAQQGQQQAQLNAAQQQYAAQQAYPQQQLDWLSTQVRGMAPITPTSTAQSGTTTGATYSASPLSQLAGGYAAYKGLSSI